MAENKEINEELLEEVNGGVEMFRKEGASEINSIKNELDKIASRVKAGQAMADVDNKKVAATGLY